MSKGPSPQFEVTKFLTMPPKLLKSFPLPFKKTSKHTESNHPIPYPLLMSTSSPSKQMEEWLLPIWLSSIYRRAIGKIDDNVLRVLNVQVTVIFILKGYLMGRALPLSL